jgi:ATP-dependent helicase/nuclease subunit B
MEAMASFRKNQPDLHRRDSRRQLDHAAVDKAADLAERLAAAIAPLETIAGSFAGIAKRHREVLVALAGDEGAFSANPDDGAELLLQVFDAIEDSAAAHSLQIRPAEYLETFASAIADRVRQRPAAPSARVSIYGLLEARLQHVDRIVLGSLVEGTWPPQTRSDPWLSRPMRRELGLDLPERRIGLSAHDFAQALGAREVVLSRADKIAGAPTVPSRFLQRLAAVSGEPWNAVRAAGRRYVELARSLDHPQAPQPIAAPEPKPPRAARPLRLSITEIEDWTRDPYTIYARHVLRLAPLDAVDAPIGARDRGTAIHAAIEEFTRRFADALPDDPVGELLAIGRRRFAPLEAFPEARAFWWPRFERIAAWFADWESERRAGVAAIHTELHGELELPLGERIFKLVGRADRIERRSDGAYLLLDYKTGKAPTANQVLLGFSPQLTLEGAILRNGGFKEIPGGGSVAGMAYVQLRGGDPPGEECEVKPKNGRVDPDAEADKALQKLRRLAARFEDENEPYRALIHSASRKHYGDYDHLARVKEWSATRDDAEAGPPS